MSLFMLKEPIAITAVSSISPLGISANGIWEKYRSNGHFFKRTKLGDKLSWTAPLPEHAKQEVEALRISDSKYLNLDDSVLFALYASRKAIRQAGWKSKDNFGINLGSSRGATTLFERYHKQFLDKGQTSTPSSPTTTLGNISSWVAHDLRTQGPQISHSITCSTALHALLNGVAWIQSGMANTFLVGGSEAPLTPFTVAQMQALKIYAQIFEEDKGKPILANSGALGGIQENQNLSITGASPSKAKGSQSLVTGRNPRYPCRALDLSKKRNAMILGEGAVVACLERKSSKNRLAQIQGIGYATEVLQHNVSISADAQCFQDSMKMALGRMDPDEIDVIVMHAPGTVKGDLSEYRAIQKVFCNKTPFLTTNKWKIGHTFGASGMLSMEMAVGMLQHQEILPVPFSKDFKIPSQIRNIIVNAVGFGGNAVSVLLSR
ncbi:MAG: beta-ketoacyl synthase N-terminal-like domain-containing protein [Bacteroidota bacterium]